MCLCALVYVCALVTQHLGEQGLLPFPGPNPFYTTTVQNKEADKIAIGHSKKELSPFGRQYK